MKEKYGLRFDLHIDSHDASLQNGSDLAEFLRKLASEIEAEHLTANDIFAGIVRDRAGKPVGLCRLN